MILDKIKALFSGKKKSGASGKYEGVVQKLHYKKGYGFISSPAFDKLVFVHFTDARSKLRVGKKVSFDVQETEKGLRATGVELIS
jgi:cold shock CspA family protein